MQASLIASIAALAIAGGAGYVEDVPLRNGTTLRGEVLELRADVLVMTLVSIPDSRLTIPLSRVTDPGLYRLRRRRARTPADHEILGDWAAERDLPKIAMCEYEASLELAAGPEAAKRRSDKLATAAERCGAKQLAEASRLVSEGRYDMAVRFLRGLVESHPSCPAADSARARIGELVVFLAQRRNAREAAGKEEASPKGADFDRALARAGAALAEGDRRRREGYLHCDDFGLAEDEFFAAFDAYREGLSALDRLKVASKEPGRSQAWKKARTTILDRFLGVHLDIAHNYVMKGNLVRASRWVGLALALDPDDPRALAVRQAIVAASESGWGRAR